MISRWFNLVVIGLALLLSAPLHAAWQSAVNGRMLGKRMPPMPPAAGGAAGGAADGVQRAALPVSKGGAADGASAVAGTAGVQVMLVDFWAPSCAPCRERVPLLNRLQHEYGPHGFTVIGMAREPPPELSASGKRVPMHYPVQWDPGGKLFDRMGMRSLPYAVLVDRNGIIVWQGDPAALGHDTIAATLAAPSLGALVRL